jgi:hypothetical protein
MRVGSPYLYALRFDADTWGGTFPSLPLRNLASRGGAVSGGDQRPSRVIFDNPHRVVHIIYSDGCWWLLLAPLQGGTTVTNRN